MAEEIRRPLMSGFCNFPASNANSHKRCPGGQRANPDRIFQPCPCKCHFPVERYECGGCGGTLVEASDVLQPLLADEDDPDEVSYVHFDERTNRMKEVYCDD